MLSMERNIKPSDDNYNMKCKKDKAFINLDSGFNMEAMKQLFSKHTDDHNFMVYRNKDILQTGS